jgi:hypothetical protein
MATLRLRGRSPLLSAEEIPGQWPPDGLDLAELTWVTPFDIAVLARTWAQIVHDGGSPSVTPPADPDVRAYLVDAGLDTVIESLKGERGGSRVEPPLVRLTHLLESDQWDDLLRDLWPAVRAIVSAYDTANSALEIMGELIDNATTHGRSDVGTFVCAQRYTGATSRFEPGIWVAIVDGGVGVPEHLRRNPRFTDIEDDVELIKRARHPWVTGTADRRGWGLKEVFDYAAASGPSDLVMRSGGGEGSFRLAEGAKVQARYRGLEHPVPGTWVHVRIGAH